MRGVKPALSRGVLLISISMIAFTAVFPLNKLVDQIRDEIKEREKRSNDYGQQHERTGDGGKD